MGNCVSGGSVPSVRIMLPEGEVAVIACPVKVSSLMREYPEHMVLWSDEVEEDSIGSFRKPPKIIIMRPGDYLVPRLTYYIYAIPPKFRDKICKALNMSSFQYFSDDWMIDSPVKSSSKAVSDGAPPRLGCGRFSLRGSSGSTKIAHWEDDLIAPASPLYLDQVTKERPGAIHEWKPVLSSIPEFPDTSTLDF